jgi:hypothetical protein
MNEMKGDLMKTKQPKVIQAAPASWTERISALQQQIAAGTDRVQQLQTEREQHVLAASEGDSLGRSSIADALATGVVFCVHLCHKVSAVN